MNANELKPEENTSLSAMKKMHEAVELNKLEEQVEDHDEENEKNIVEQVQEKELDIIGKEEFVARANVLRQREREQLAEKVGGLGINIEDGQVKDKNLSEQNQEKSEKNIAKKVGNITDNDRQLLTERENIRKRELMEQVRNQFRVVDVKFHFKDQPHKLAFKDKGERMVSASNDDRVAKAMAMMAEAKGWETVKVSGHPDFQREVWLEASMRGIKVRGFNPAEQDLKLLEEKREHTMRNTVEHDKAVHERTATAQHSKKYHKTNSSKEKNQGDENELPNQAGSMTEKTAIRTYAGRVIEQGTANFNFDLQEKPNYFVRLETDKGEKVVWGVDLKRAMSDSEIKIGDDITLAFMGSKAVSVEALQRNKEGKVIGAEKITTNRNVWDAHKSDKAKVTEAIASVLIDSKVKNSAQREALKEAVGSRILEREKINKVPTISVYDKAAPTKSQPHNHTKPIVERRPERTR